MKTLAYIFAFPLILNIYAQNTSNWEVLNEGKGNFDKIDFISDDVAFLVSLNYGILLKTVDGGDTWNFVSNTIKIDGGGLYV